MNPEISENGYSTFWDTLVPAEKKLPCKFCPSEKEATMCYSGSFNYRGKKFNSYTCVEPCEMKTMYMTEHQREFHPPTFSFERKEAS